MVILAFARSQGCRPRGGSGFAVYGTASTKNSLLMFVESFAGDLVAFAVLSKRVLKAGNGAWRVFGPSVANNQPNFFLYRRCALTDYNLRRNAAEQLVGRNNQ